MSESRALLITGATGRQGGAVIDALLAKNSDDFLILAVTRSTDSPAAKRILAKSSSIKLVKGDLNDVPALFKAAKDAAGWIPLWGVYSVQVFFAPGASLESELRQGKAMIDESIKAGVRHFVYSSVERGGDQRSWENRTPVPHFQTKYVLEHYLLDQLKKAKSTMEWTIIRPTMFMDNLEPSFNIRAFLTMLRQIMGETPLQWVACKDIGIAVAEAFHDLEGWKGKSTGIVSEVLTFSEVNRAFEKATGKPAQTTYGLVGKLLKYGVPGTPQYGTMTIWLAKEGFKADVDENRRFNPNPTTLEEWLRQSPSVWN
ncbi:unnamed protein product [Clonostachys solani]|uniref:NmrA-like domain-containing protein n=1 Tax=Clonostachys solani TaxID=160281 RepID=A0A9N9YW55_9HYPO|nr:unnamed protein product [Clonostachys solani]